MAGLLVAGIAALSLYQIKRTSRKPPAYVPKDEVGAALYRKAKTLIPGGTALLSKRPENHLPDQWPCYYQQLGPGPYCQDLSGNRYMELAYGTCYSPLGFHDPDVNAAVIAAVHKGVMGTLNVPEDVELAELLIEMHPWARGGMARFCRGGGEANSIAIRIARAHTGRDTVAFCGYHGWGDFYLAANISTSGDQCDAIAGHQLTGLSPAGVPGGLGGSMLAFHYNQIQELQAHFQAHPRGIAAVIMEPCRAASPQPGFLEAVRELCTAHGTVLIFDEVSAGFRETLGGRHLLYGVEPDVATFAKALSSGYAMGAVLGRGPVMEAAQTSFISSSYWTERIGPSAAVATLKKMKRVDAVAHNVKMGKKVKAGWLAAAAAEALEVSVGGIDPWPALSIAFKGEGVDDPEKGRLLSSLFVQEMLRRGFIAGTCFALTYAHKDEHIELYLEAVREVFRVLKEWLTAFERTGDYHTLRARLEGPIQYGGFERLT